jgi:hypothetical protein
MWMFRHFLKKISPEDSVIMIKSRYEDTNDPQQNAETVFESEQENEILVGLLQLCARERPRRYCFRRRSLREFHLRLPICKDFQAWTGPAIWKRKEECSTINIT